MKPKVVIPCHYNIPALFTKEYCKADEAMFKIQVEKLGSDCQLLKYGDVIEVYGKGAALDNAHLNK